MRKAGRLDESLAAFRDALAAYEGIGKAGSIRVARWQVANVLRLKGARDEALAMQLALEKEAAAAGQPDPYVYDELVLLHRASGNEQQALVAEKRAASVRKR